MADPRFSWSDVNNSVCQRYYIRLCFGIQPEWPKHISIRGLQVVKVISIKSSIRKKEMLYREFPDTTVTTCNRVMVFLVPAVCAGNKVRNMIVVDSWGVGMMPTSFFVFFSHLGCQGARCSPVYADCLRWSESEEMQKNFVLSPQSTATRQKTVLCMVNGNHRGATFIFFWRKFEKVVINWPTSVLCWVKSPQNRFQILFSRNFWSFSEKRLSPCKKLSCDGWGAHERRWYTWSGLSIKTTPGVCSVQESVQATKRCNACKSRAAGQMV